MNQLAVMNQLSVWDYALIAGYVIGVLLLGLMFSGRQKSLKEYFLASGKLPWWAVSCSLMATSLSPLTFSILRDHKVRVALASEQAIRRAQELIMARMKLVVEPSAAVPLAAMLEDPERVTGQLVGVILSGGNTDAGAPVR